MKWIFFDKGKVVRFKPYRFPQPYIKVQKNKYATFIRFCIRLKENVYCMAIRVKKVNLRWLQKVIKK